MRKILQDGKPHEESTKELIVHESDLAVKELDATKEQLENLRRQYDELEAKSKADIKLLVKEVKSLRSSQKGLTQELSQTLENKSETEVVIALLNYVFHVWFYYFK